MDITKKIQELEAEKAQFEKTKADAHEEIKKRNTQIQKLRTIAKHAEELFAEPPAEVVFSTDQLNF